MRVAAPWLVCIACSYAPPTDQSPADEPTPDSAITPDTGGNVITDAAPDTPITPICEGYTAAGNSNYLVVTTPADWPAAQQNCAATANGHLVVIADATENALVRGMISTTLRFWMGFSDRDTENTWLWLDNTAVPRDAQFWDGGQPNDNQTFGGEDCGEMSNTGTWNDKTCTAAQQYICECP